MNNIHFSHPAVLFLLGILLLLSGCSREDSDSNLPSRPEIRYVYDEAGILKSDTRQHILAVNEALRARTGTEITVACVRSTGEESLSDYTRDLFLAWEIGAEKDTTGILLVLCPAQTGYWCRQSRGLETILPDDEIDRILRQSLDPHFLAGSYDEGVRAFFDVLIPVLSPLSAPESAETSGSSAERDEAAPRRESNSHVLGWAVIVVLLLLLILHFVLVREQTPRRQKRRTIYSSPRTRRRVPGARPSPVRRPVPPPNRIRPNTTRPYTGASRPSRPNPPSAHTRRPSGDPRGTRRY